MTIAYHEEGKGMGCDIRGCGRVKGKVNNEKKNTFYQYRISFFNLYLLSLIV